MTTWQAMRKAGLRDVEVVEQTSFPVDLLVNDETARALMKDAKLTPKRLLELAGTVVSLKVEATKPKSSKPKAAETRKRTRPAARP